MEDEIQSTPVLLVNKKNGQIYENVKGNIFKNIVTGQEGEITKELAEKFLAIPVNLNYLVVKNPHLLKLLKEFHLDLIL